MLPSRGAAPARRWRRPREGISSGLQETRFESHRFTAYPGPCPHLFPSHCNPTLCNSPCYSFSVAICFVNPRSPCVQDGEIQASNKLGAYTVPTNFLNNTVEAKAAAKKLGAATAKQAATEQAKKAEKKPDAPVARR